MPTKKKTIKNVVEGKVEMKVTEAPHAAQVIHNGLSEAILGFSPGGIGTQLSQVDTLFRNNRWYLVSNMRQLLAEIYVEHGLIQTVVNVPVDDALRGGVEIKSKQLSPEQVEELQTHLEREDILDSSVGQGQKWTRLFGGGGVLILTDQDPASPLDVSKIRPDSPLEFRAVDLWELYPDTKGQEGALEQPNTEYYIYYGVRLHKSRVMKMQGLKAPSFIRPRLRGWGFSIVESLVMSINQYLKSNNLTFEVLDEFKLDVFAFDGLTQTLLSADGTAKVQQRTQIANQQKNFQNAITMDAKDRYDQKQITFAGLADMMKEFRIQIASDLRMPLTKIFGISAAGFSSGEDDIENYNAMVESTIRSKMKAEIVRIIEMICQKLFGFVPDDISVNFKPLRVLSSVDEETVKTQKFQRLMAARTAGEISAEEFRDACNKDELLGVQLDTTDSALDFQEEESDPAKKDQEDNKPTKKE